MSERTHIPIGLRMMAAVCRICPCCVIARRWPNSRFARRFRRVQHHCPFCRAYRQIRIRNEQERLRAVPVRQGSPSE